MHACLPAAALLPAELRSSVSFGAARRAVAEAKAHAKAKAAALLQASSASWADKLEAAKADRAALQAQLQRLQQDHQKLQQQVRRTVDPWTMHRHQQLVELVTLRREPGWLLLPAQC